MRYISLLLCALLLASSIAVSFAQNPVVIDTPDSTNSTTEAPTPEPTPDNTTAAPVNPTTNVATTQKPTSPPIVCKCIFLIYLLFNFILFCLFATFFWFILINIRSAAPCSSFLNCSTCTSNHDCVWCGTECTSGSWYGPKPLKHTFTACKTWYWRKCSGKRVSSLFH